MGITLKFTQCQIFQKNFNQYQETRPQMKPFHISFIFWEVNKIPHKTPHFYRVFPSMISNTAIFAAHYHKEAKHSKCATNIQKSSKQTEPAAYLSVMNWGADIPSSLIISDVTACNKRQGQTNPSGICPCFNRPLNMAT